MVASRAAPGQQASNVLDGPFIEQAFVINTMLRT